MHTLRLGTDRGGRLLKRLDAIRNPGMISAAPLGQLQSARRTGEELHTEIVFEFGYVLAHGTLGNVQFPSSSGEAPVAGSDNKGSDGVERNINDRIFLMIGRRYPDLIQSKKEEE